jgi:ketosteroid isomerase-like protein
MSQANFELARRGFAAAACGDFDAVREFLDPAVRWHGGDPTSPGACQNREQALEFMRKARDRGSLGELVDVVDAGDQVVVVIRPRGGSDGPAQLIANLTTLRDGRAIEMVHYPNPGDALAAAGV